MIFLIEFSREPKSDQPGATWIHGSNKARTDARASEVAVVLAGYVRALGYGARGHVSGNTLLNLEALAQRAGIARSENGLLKMPFLKCGFALAAISTDLPLEIDLPIAPKASLDWPDSDAYMGKHGTRPGWAESETELRPLHLGRYPMETLKRV
ncbi:MAG: Fe-S protein, partial [Betaproteobacteria bacterium]|nr:Fe-S protein [Betaproteobacteria bacterium]